MKQPVISTGCIVESQFYKTLEMRVIMFKKLLALLLALSCSVTLLAGCGGGNEETGNDFNPDLENYVAPDLSGVNLTIYSSENTDFDAEGCWVEGKIEEKLGVSIEFVELDSWNEQYLPMMAEGNPPDLTMHNAYLQTYFQFGEDGAYVNLMNYLDIMPNVKAFIEDPAHKSIVERFTSEDGSLYLLPIYIEAQHDPYVFLYRKDIFEANNLTFPTNQEEFVATLRKLKELYPDSYPFVMRQMTGNMHSIQSFGHLWGASHVNLSLANSIFNQDENGNFYSAQLSDSYKEMAQFLNQLTQEGLMHPSCATMDTATWYESFASSTSFISFDKTDRMPSITQTGKSLDENFHLMAAAPFNFGTYAKTSDTVTTSFAVGKGGGTTVWYAIGNNKNKEYSMAYLDWVYSEEAKILTNWGVEGESYTVDENGNKQFIRSFLDEHGGLLAAGLYQPGLTSTRMIDAYKASQTESEAESLAIGLQYVDKGTPQHMLSYTEDEQFVFDTYATALYNYLQAEWLKFYLGKRDFSEWDSVMETLKSKYHYDDLMKIHQDALARVLEENA